MEILFFSPGLGSICIWETGPRWFRTLCVRIQEIPLKGDLLYTFKHSDVTFGFKTIVLLCLSSLLKGFIRAKWPLCLSCPVSMNHTVSVLSVEGNHQGYVPNGPYSLHSALMLVI